MYDIIKHNKKQEDITMKFKRLISFLITLIILSTSLASCGLFPFGVSEDDNAVVTLNFHIDGEWVKTQTLTVGEIKEGKMYIPEEDADYRFVGWFIDGTCEIPFSLSDVSDRQSIDLYGKLLPIGGGAQGGDHFWILGVCRICDAICEHKWDHAVCSVCDMPCDHGSTMLGDECKTCGKLLTPKKIKITIGAPDEQEELTYASIDFDTPMYLDELLAHCMTYWGYMFRYDIFDISINGNVTDNGATLISEDATVIAKLKENIIRVHATLTNTDGRQEDQIFYLPESGITLERLGLIIFPQSGGFDKLLSQAEIVLNGRKITSNDAKYKIAADCNIDIRMKGKAENDSITVTIIQNGRLIGETSVKPGVSIIEPLKIIDHLKLEDMLMNGEVYVNGERIYDEVALHNDTTIEFVEFAPGTILVKFIGNTDLGRGDRVEKSIITTTDTAFENIIYEMFGYTWEEYTDKFYQTRLCIQENGETTWLPVNKDTMFSKSVTVDSLVYYPHDRVDEVTLGITITGIYEGEITVPYDTMLSTAFDMLGLSFEASMHEWQMFINVFSLVNDSKLKYDSFIYGYARCDGHVWENSECQKCGMSCYHSWNNGTCDICRTECTHDWNGDVCTRCGSSLGTSKTRTYTYYENICGKIKIIENQTLNNSVTTISDLMNILGLPWELIERREIFINGVEVDSDHILVHPSETHIKIEFIRTQDTCLHVFNDGICSYCAYRSDDLSKAITVTYQNRTTHVPYSSRLCDVIATYFDLDFEYLNLRGYWTVILPDGKQRVYGSDRINKFGLTSVELLYTSYESDPALCTHSWIDGICDYCHTQCTHDWNSGLCMICHMFCAHNWVDNWCPICNSSNLPPQGVMCSITVIRGSFYSPSTFESEHAVTGEELITTLLANGVITDISDYDIYVDDVYMSNEIFLSTTFEKYGTRIHFVYKEQ